MELEKRYILKNDDDYYFTGDYDCTKSKNPDNAYVWHNRENISVKQDDLYEFTNDGELSFEVVEVIHISDSEFDVDSEWGEIQDIKIK